MFDFEEANEAIKKNEVMSIEAGGITSFFFLYRDWEA